MCGLSHFFRSEAIYFKEKHRNRMNPSDIPLSLYIHFPWCIRKCPYCDFNSHELKNELPEEAYVAALIRDLKQEKEISGARPLRSIFMGGGTPSLFSPQALHTLLKFIFSTFSCDAEMEITLEANPGTVDFKRFADFRAVGINRLSMGIQSFQDKQLKLLGRIHSSEDAQRAIVVAKQAGFTRFNLDVMHGLPEQTQQDAMQDIQTALSFQPPHFSWYQLTIEPQTYFHRFPPALPQEETLLAIQEEGQSVLQSAGLMQYEISAYSQPEFTCQHNINYWEFGDYIGVGAGAHGKITQDSTVTRYEKYRHPKEYLSAESSYRVKTENIQQAQLPFEFMLNALRLKKLVLAPLFQQRTGLSFADMSAPLELAKQKGLIELQPQQIIVTDLGYRFLNDLIELFLPA